MSNNIKAVPQMATMEQILAGRAGPACQAATQILEDAGWLTGMPCAEIYERMVQAAPVNPLHETAPALLVAAKQLIIQIESMDTDGEDSGFFLFLQDLRREVAKAEGRS